MKKGGVSVPRRNGRIEHFFELIYLYGELIVYCPMPKCSVFLLILPKMNYMSVRAEGYLKCPAYPDETFKLK